MTHFEITYHFSLVKVQTNYCNYNLLILDVRQLNKIIKLYYFHTLKALWDGQGKIKMYYGVSRVQKQLSWKRYNGITFSYVKIIFGSVISLHYKNTLFIFLFHLEGKLPIKTALKFQQYYPIVNKVTYLLPKLSTVEKFITFSFIKKLYLCTNLVIFVERKY